MAQPHDSRLMDCEQALRLIAEFLDRELEPPHDADVAHHLDVCRSCYSRVEFEKRLKSRLRELRQQPVDPSFERRVCDLARTFTLS